MESPEQTAILNNEVYTEVFEGLSQDQKCLPSKLFYDERGSELFEAICDLDEYYLTNVEASIMEHHIKEITHLLGEHVQLIELGSGNSQKTRFLLDNLQNMHSYMPVDISERYLNMVAHKLNVQYPDLKITPVAADYTQPFRLPDSSNPARKIIYYPGSTIGNFIPSKARKFLELIADLAGPGGGLLIGFDLKKDVQILEAAYNDSKGLTAAFNKNILVRLNNELGADFNPNQFRHHAFFNEEESRIEMHLVSCTEQRVRIDDVEVLFSQDESIHTENSYKYSLEAFRKLYSACFEIGTIWTDPQQQFCVQYLLPKDH